MEKLNSNNQREELKQDREDLDRLNEMMNKERQELELMRSNILKQMDLLEQEKQDIKEGKEKLEIIKIELQEKKEHAESLSDEINRNKTNIKELTLKAQRERDKLEQVINKITLKLKEQEVQIDTTRGLKQELGSIEKRVLAERTEMEHLRKNLNKMKAELEAMMISISGERECLRIK
ncbi:centrosomal protein of 290 kDa-like protein [Lates japonicus]|uniref:Centrosomal protein of 290 kDa-like protein n=1 Tax=Lates japonicus TaxID=270547 RepID=A0AAD3M4B5_LATJO|nr:centrosomal protein of 290 kDa-like protein [Lates japonicus]